MTFPKYSTDRHWLLQNGWHQVTQRRIYENMFCPNTMISTLAEVSHSSSSHRRPPVHTPNGAKTRTCRRNDAAKINNNNFVRIHFCIFVCVVGGAIVVSAYIVLLHSSMAQNFRIFILFNFYANRTDEADGSEKKKNCQPIASLLLTPQISN